MNIIFLAILLLNAFIALNASPVGNVLEDITNPMENEGMLEGDMKVFTRSKTLGITNSIYIWPAGVVFYEISADFTGAERTLMLDSMALITNKTRSCITFRPKTSTTANWISIKNLSGCWSYVGRNQYFGGAQEVSIQKGGCMYKGTIVHELLHAIGFWHEQSRPDRDNFIKVNYQNVRADMVSNFNKQTGTQTFNLPYDYNSIMQYGNTAFSSNGLPTMVALTGTPLLSAYQRNTFDSILTSSDVSSIRALYKC